MARPASVATHTIDPCWYVLLLVAHCAEYQRRRIGELIYAIWNIRVDWRIGRELGVFGCQVVAMAMLLRIPVCGVYLALSITADETHISAEFGGWRRFIHQKWLCMEPCLIAIAADWAKVNVIKWSRRQNYAHVFVLWGKLLFSVGKQPCCIATT